MPRRNVLFDTTTPPAKIVGQGTAQIKVASGIVIPPQGALIRVALLEEEYDLDELIVPFCYYLAPTYAEQIPVQLSLSVTGGPAKGVFIYLYPVVYVEDDKHKVLIRGIAINDSTISSATTTGDTYDFSYYIVEMG